jgi:hypothetical protein
MFARIFGAPRAPPKPASVAPVAPPPTDTLALLRRQEATLEKRMENLEAQQKTLKDRASVYVKAGDKVKALALLKQKALLEEQHRSTSGMLEKIVTQRLTLEMGQIQVQTIRAMEATNTYMKATAIDVDKASEVIDETVEQMEAAKEITRLVCEPLPGQAEVDEAAEAELAALSEVAPATASPPAPAQVAPTLIAPMPAPPVSAPQLPSSMDDELAALEVTARAESRVAVPS